MKRYNYADRLNEEIAMKKPTRRNLTIVSAAAALMLGISACGGSSGDEEGGDVELRFSWWGSTERAEITQQAIDLFEEQNPGITVRPEYTDFDAYFDRLATTVAGRDAPDVITLGGAYPREYGDRGALLDLDEVSETLISATFLTRHSVAESSAERSMASPPESTPTPSWRTLECSKKRASRCPTTKPGAGRTTLTSRKPSEKTARKASTVPPIRLPPTHWTCTRANWVSPSIPKREG
ncbi:extracellular solute-binding protein [Arthrobacter sp. AET 35A]|nr:extracellular solute-binding protein [Arthrobacter sp. AET 35A]